MKAKKIFKENRIPILLIVLICGIFLAVHKTPYMTLHCPPGYEPVYQSFDRCSNTPSTLSGWKACEWYNTPSSHCPDCSKKYCNPICAKCVKSSPNCDVGSICKKEKYYEYSCDGKEVVKKQMTKYFTLNSDCNCVYSYTKQTAAGTVVEICDYKCRNGHCVDEPSCNVGSECDRKDNGLICKNGDVYREYKIYVYDSDCNCIFDDYETVLTERCSIGCEDGQCIEVVCSENQEKCVDSDYFVCLNNSWINKGITVGKCGIECLVDDDCSSGYYCYNYACIEGESPEPEPEPFEFDWKYAVLIAAVSIFGIVMYWYFKK